MTQVSIKRHRKLILLMSSALMLMFSAVVLYKGCLNFSKGVNLKVQSLKRMGLPIRETSAVGEVYFSGRDAELRIQPESLLQAILLEPVKNKNIDFFDLLDLLIMTGIMYYMFYDSTDGTVFTKKMSTGFISVIFAIGIIDLFTNIGRDMLARYYIAHITHGLFTSSIDFRSVSFNYLIYPVLVGLMRIIPTSGLELQKQAELTI